MRDLILYTNPFATLIDNVIEDFFTEEWEEYSPKTDVVEKDNEYLIKVDVPGFNEKNLKVEIKNRNLIISGKIEKEDIKENEEERWIIKERNWSSFRREFLLPENADIENIEARLENGVLNIKIKKNEKEQTKEISIK